MLVAQTVLDCSSDSMSLAQTVWYCSSDSMLLAQMVWNGLRWYVSGSDLYVTDSDAFFYLKFYTPFNIT